MALVLSAAFVCLFMFQLTDAHVTGNYHETDEEIMALVQRGPLKNNTLFLSAYFTDRSVKNYAFIDTVDVAYVKHDTVSVSVREKPLVGYVRYDDGYWYFDRNGTVLVRSVYKESDYKKFAEGGQITQKEINPAGDDSSDALLEKTDGELLLTDEETYADPDTAYYDGNEDEDAYYEDEGEDAYYEDEGEDAYPDNEEDGNSEYTEDDGDGDTAYDEADDLSSGEDENGEYADSEDAAEESEENQDDVILIQPELMDGTTPTPIPADESSVSAVTPIPAEEVLVKEYTSEEICEGNYIPEIKGLRFTEAVVGEKLPVRYASIYAALGDLKKFADTYGIYPSSVDISGTGDLQLHFNDVTVNLGSEEHIEKRLSVFRQIMNELLGRSGTLHLENYTGAESRLIFSKNEKNS